MYDLIVKNGRVIDGTGNPGVVCDVAIADGKIVRIEKNLDDESHSVIDAQGLTVTPGFIDSHSHSDDAVFSHPDMIEKIEQGITTSIAGQCGITLAPAEKEKNDEILTTFGTMVNRAKDIPLGSNIKSFVGHGALRKATVGYENRKPTEREMEQMKFLLRDAMENGAVGLSFGLIYTPSCYADTNELIELAKVVKEYGGMISAHIRNEGFELIESVEEFLTVIKTVNIRAVFSHHKSMYKPNWGKVETTLKMLKDAVAEGYDIYCDVYPYEASSTSLVPTLIPKELRDMENDRIVNLVSGSNMRAKIKEAYINKTGKDLSNLLIVSCSGHQEYEGLRIDEIAKLRGQDDFEAAFDIIIDSGATAKICNFCINEEEIEKVLKYERSMICTDSSVVKNNKSYHPRLRGSFPRVLGKYVREKKVITLEEAIRKCTFMPATVYKLQNKGLIREGYDADICIFDAEKIIDKADYINPHNRCEGLNYVIIGGEIAAENAVYNGKRNGRFLLE